MSEGHNNANDDDLLANPSLDIESAWLQMTEAIKEVRHPGIKEALFWIVAIHTTAHLLKIKLDGYDDDLPRRLFAQREELTHRLFDDMIDFTHGGEHNADDADCIVTMLDRMGIVFPVPIEPGHE